MQKPPCWTGFCRNSSAQIFGVDDWIVMFMRLRGSEILKSAGMGRQMLEWAQGDDPDTVETLCRMESIYNELVEQQREVERQQRKARK